MKFRTGFPHLPQHQIQGLSKPNFKFNFIINFKFNNPMVWDTDHSTYILISLCKRYLEPNHRGHRELTRATNNKCSCCYGVLKAVRLQKQSQCGLGGLIQWAGRRGRERGGSPEDVGKETSGQSSFGTRSCQGRQSKCKLSSQNKKPVFDAATIRQLSQK